MTPELTYLLYAILLYFAFILIAAGRAIREYGLTAQAGARDNQAEPSPYLARARRLCANMQENMIIFGLLVIIAHLTGTQNDMTIFGAKLFFIARVVHGLIYLLGWPSVRPLAWGASVVGMALIAIELVKTL